MSLYKKELVPNYEKSTRFGEANLVDLIKTDQLLSGELELPPYSKAGYDAGHDGADEVFFIRQGTAKIIFPTLNESEMVNEGSYIMMPRGVPHEVHNTTGKTLKVVYFQVVK